MHWVSHLVTHSGWKAWEQGSRTTDSMSENSTRHTGHLETPGHSLASTHGKLCTSECGRTSRLGTTSSSNVRRS